MKKEVMTKWVEALRSGKYEQGQGALKNHGRYCCLGVLCDISGLGEFDKNDYFINSNGEVKSSVPTPDVTKWAGMKYPDGVFSNYKTLVGLNDSDGFSFEEIANLIEIEYEIL